MNIFIIYFLIGVSQKSIMTLLLYVRLRRAGFCLFGSLINSYCQGQDLACSRSLIQMSKSMYERMSAQTYILHFTMFLYHSCHVYMSISEIILRCDIQ